MFFIQDGSFLPVGASLQNKYNFAHMIGGNEPAFPNRTKNVKLRFEVNMPTTTDEKSILIGSSVARVPIQKLPSRLVDMMPLGES